MNSRQKGRRTEKMCEKKLLELGYLVYLVPPPRKFNKNNDIFHLWDILCSKETEHFPILIQVKTNYTGGCVQYRKFQENFPGYRCQLWNWKSRQGWFIKDFKEVQDG